MKHQILLSRKNKKKYFKMKFLPRQAKWFSSFSVIRHIIIRHLKHRQCFSLTVHLFGAINVKVAHFNMFYENLYRNYGSIQKNRTILLNGHHLMHNNTTRDPPPCIHHVGTRAQVYNHSSEFSTLP